MALIYDTSRNYLDIAVAKPQNNTNVSKKSIGKIKSPLDNLDI